MNPAQHPFHIPGAILFTLMGVLPPHSSEEFASEEWWVKAVSFTAIVQGRWDILSELSKWLRSQTKLLREARARRRVGRPLGKKIIGARLRQLREAAGISQAKMAERVNVDTKTYERIEIYGRGDRRLLLKIFKEISAELNLEAASVGAYIEGLIDAPPDAPAGRQASSPKTKVGGAPQSIERHISSVSLKPTVWRSLSAIRPKNQRGKT
jgi:transcriptional regulator with XRE-family HTH domain